MTTEQVEPGEWRDRWASREAAEAWRRRDAHRNQYMSPATELMLDLAKVARGSRVLDVAAGTGGQTVVAAQRVGPTGLVLATDVSASMLEQAAEAAREAGLNNVRTQAVDAQRLDLEPDSFDAAISRNGLQFIRDLHTALVAIRGALKPGGRLAAIAWGPEEKNLYHTLQRRAVQRYKHVPESTPGAPDISALGHDGVFGEALRAAGFRDVAIHPITVVRRFESAADGVGSMLDAALGPMIQGLPDAQREQALSELEQELVRLQGPSGIELPSEALVGVATK